MVEGVEGFGDGFETEALSEGKGAAEAGVHGEEVEADAGVAADDGAGKNVGAVGDAGNAGAQGCALNAIGSGGDVEG